MSNVPNDTGERIERLTKQRHYVRAAFFLVVGATLAGNVAQAQPTIIGRTLGLVAPGAYLLCTEILLRVNDIHPAYRRVGGTVAASVGLGALATSYTHLLHLAQGAGWDDWTAYTLPIFLDVVALMTTAYLLGIGRRMVELRVEARVEQAQPRRGRPRKEAPEPIITPEPKPEPVRSRSAAEINAERIRDKFPDRVPTVREVRDAFGWGGSTAGSAVKVLRASVAA